MQKVQLGDHYIKPTEIDGKFPHTHAFMLHHSILLYIQTDIQTCLANQTVRVRACAVCAYACAVLVTLGCLRWEIPMHQGAPSGKVTAAGD